MFKFKIHLPGSDSSTRFDYRHYEWEHSYNVDAKVSFRTLWEKINGPESWAANPWVWVIKYKVLSKTGKPVLTGEVKHGPITTKKITKNAWVATVQVTEPLKCEVEQQGISEQNAIDKLKKFLAS